MATITGANFIGRTRVEGGEPFRATDPTAGQPIEPAFSSASAADVDRACALAREAFPAFRALDRAARADLLDAIGDAIMALGDDLLDRAHKESGLPLARLTGERGRTVGQLKLFATVLRDGGYLDLRIEHADAERQPLPKPDLRLRKIPVGPVAVFGASNFPLAFSVAGGDTASALAAGCPVVVKGHPAHPGTSELIATAIVSAVEAAGLPEGVFSLLNGTSNALGEALVSDPRIKAVGFTGSRGGGLALMKIAASRPEPIPVYAEMSAINPVVLFPGALDARAEALGKAYVGSLTMGAGQFCTNPGLVLAVEGDGLDRFVAAAAEALTGAPAATMLTPGIHKAYESGVEKLGANAHVETVARGQAASGPTQGQAAIFATDAATLVHDKEIGEEVFGASSLLVRCKDAAELAHALSEIEGQLTATVHFEPADVDAVREVLPVLEDRVGRILANGWPTGVEVSPAMVHGGPFPATSDGRTTSVGTLAIDRFVRPVSYQDIPEALLPADLRGDGAAGVPRRVDGKVRID